MRLGEFLIQQRLLSTEGLSEALEAQVIHGGRLGTNLLELGLVVEKDLAKSLGTLHQVAFASGEMLPEAQAIQLLDPDFADQMDLLPMRTEPTRVAIATMNPRDVKTLDAIAFKIGKRVVPVVVPEFRMHQLLRKYCKAFRPLRAIDLGQIRKPKSEDKSQKGSSDLGGDLMSEEEFQSMYASVLKGDSPGATTATKPMPIAMPETGAVPITPPPAAQAVAPPAPAARPPPPAAARPTQPPATARPPAQAPAARQPPAGATVIPPAQLAPAARPPPAGAAVQTPQAPRPLEPMPTVPARAAAPMAAPPAPVAAPPPPVPEAPPPQPLSFAEAQAALSKSDDREDVATNVLRFALGKWRRSLLLSVQGDLVTGWRGLGKGVKEKAVQRIGIALRSKSTLKLVRDSRSHFVGAVTKDQAMDGFYQLLGGGYPKTAVLMPLLVRGKVVHLLYVDNGPLEFTPPDIGELLILSQSVGRSYESMIKRRKVG